MSDDFSPEKFCGIEEYGTSFPGLGGRIKTNPEDFVVQEVPMNLPEGGPYLFCKLKKRNMTTYNAIEKLSSILGISKRRIGYAGLKDKRACTTQFITIEGIESESVDVDTDCLKVRPLKSVSKPLKPGDLKKNHFNVVLRSVDLDMENCSKKIRELFDEIKEGVPNYFGLQRFGGERPVTHIVGRNILKRNFGEAVREYLTRTFNANDEISQFRQRLRKEGDYKDALDYFPKHLVYERSLLEKVVEVGPCSEEDWLSVLRCLPKDLLRLFVHSYQSYVFNKAVSGVLRSSETKENFPGKIPGYRTELDSSEFDTTLGEVLESDGLETKDFKFDELKGLSSSGSLRAVLITPDLSLNGIEDGESPDLEIEFSLKPGRYATVVLREIVK